MKPSQARRIVNSTISEWRTKDTFAEACWMMARCVRQNLWTPGNFIPTTDEEYVEVASSGMDEETKAISNELAELNELGFLTLFSQPSSSGRIFQLEAFSGLMIHDVALEAKRMLPNLFFDIEPSRVRRPITWKDGKVFTRNSPQPIEMTLRGMSEQGLSSKLIHQIRSICKSVAVTSKEHGPGAIEDTIECLDIIMSRR